MNNTHSNLQTYAPIVNRIGIALVFLWFGINQLINPANFIGYLPSFAFSLPYAQTLVMINGIFEIIFAGLLLIGIWTRFSAHMLALHLLLITIVVTIDGDMEVAVRDFGLLLANIAVAIWGEDKWCLSYLKKK